MLCHQHNYEIMYTQMHFTILQANYTTYLFFSLFYSMPSLFLFTVSFSCFFSCSLYTFLSPLYKFILPPICMSRCKHTFFYLFLPALTSLVNIYLMFSLPYICVFYFTFLVFFLFGVQQEKESLYSLCSQRHNGSCETHKEKRSNAFSDIFFVNCLSFQLKSPLQLLLEVTY